MTRYLVGKASDTDFVATAIAGREVGGIVNHGIFDCTALEFVGIDPPDAPSVNLAAPEPVEGEPEGWLYFKRCKWAAYTEDLVAVRLVGPGAPEAWEP